ncbi:MAG TPA: hypothetical protein VK993_12200 [Chthoniobacterales bacterium]|nr:hypothetical protein [Chthoniobacterales bacterium]
MKTKAAPILTGSAAEMSTLEGNCLASRHRGRAFGHAVLLGVVAFFATLAAAAPINLSPAESMRIGRKIWQNECGGTVSGLTSWNTGENFASLGIGHFIWYPKGVLGPFDESFPELASFAASRNAELPEVVRANRNSGCPWSSRAEFLAAADSAEMKQLRQFLADTVAIQAEFLVLRLQKALPKMLAEAPAADRANIERQFDRTASTPQGCYALVDYVNFKGEGVLETERYNGQGWGLLQVLQGMSGSERGASAAREFGTSAAKVLSQRVENSPSERKESQWLAGWLKRVKTYAQG